MVLYDNSFPETTEKSGKAVLPAMRGQPIPSNAEQLSDFLTAICEPKDIVEIRLLGAHGARSIWRHADEIIDDIPHLAAENGAGFNIHFGVNPRRAFDERGDASVLLAPCVFADFDHKTYDEATATLKASGLPVPTAILRSGHGIHTYWRLQVPIGDMNRWREAQRDLAKLLGSDPKICNAERLMRLPGFMNLKLPAAPCELIECIPTRRYDIQTILALLPDRTDAVPRPRTSADANSIVLAGNRNSTLASLAGNLRNFGLSGEEMSAALLALNASRCQPPLEETEVERIAESICRYPSAVEQRKLPTIIITNRQLRDRTDDALRALADANSPLRLFVREGTLVALSSDDAGRCRLASLTDTALRGYLARTADFVRVSEKNRQPVETTPPMDVVRDIATLNLTEHLQRLGITTLPSISGITETPVLREDGTILDKPGYDAKTQLYYAPLAGFVLPPIPETPTRADIDAAKSVIEEAIGEFPFDSEADHANAYAALLTPFIRNSSGQVPLAVFDAPQAGTGKSRLVETITAIATGSECAMFGQPESDAEFRKAISAQLLAGSSLIVIDNVCEPLSSASLSRALTATVWRDRRLGVLESIDVPQMATWFATGNNVQLGGDMARRSYLIRLDAKLSRPWLGRTFRHDPLLLWVRENRGRLVAAILTLARAWFVAGKPEPTNSPILGSFEKWCRIVGGILENAGITGFLANSSKVYENADTDAEQWERFLRIWRSRFGEIPMTVSDFIERAKIIGNGELRDAMPDSAGLSFELISGRYGGTEYRVRSGGRPEVRFGKALKARVERRYGEENLYIVRDENDSHQGVARWAIRATTPAPSPADLEPPTPPEPADPPSPPAQPACVLAGVDLPEQTQVALQQSLPQI